MNSDKIANSDFLPLKYCDSLETRVDYFIGKFLIVHAQQMMRTCRNNDSQTSEIKALSILFQRVKNEDVTYLDFA